MPSKTNDPSAPPRLRLGERLIQSGLVTEGQLESALGVQKRTKEPLGRVLVGLGFLSEDDLGRVLAADLGVPYLELAQLAPDPELLKLVTADFARRHVFVPVRREDGQIVVAMANPANIVSIDAIKEWLRAPVKVAAAGRREITAVITRLLEHGAARAEPETAAASGRPVEPLGGGHDTIALTERILDQGLRWLATDIHVEPEEKLLRVRYRVDGVMVAGESLPKDAAAGILSRIKILASLDITERRLPQDGRVKLARDGNPIDVRVSIMPTVHGENAVLRVLDRSNVVLNLDDLGIVGPARAELEKLATAPHGMLLVSGPTGSGKTTTLYAILRSLDALTQKIVTVEDPVEYQLPLVRQSQIDPAIHYGFSEGLRSVLRQDPDVILVGEIRDRETADMALRASLTGHLVLSSIHTNTAVGVVTRLIDLEIDRFLVSSSLSGAIAQRLVRRVCHHCKAERAPTAAEAEWLALEPGRCVVEGKGCAACRGLGFAGRVAVWELFVMDDECVRILAKGGREYELSEHARATGRRTLWDDAREKVLAGATTVAEVMHLVKRS